MSKIRNPKSTLRTPLHPVLRFIYLFLRFTAWVGVNIFYRRRIVLGREHLKFNGPAIIVVNHPSTLMDVLNACLHIRQECFFLANYGLFKHPVANWLLTRLYCIPVKRREDVPEGEDRNNDAAFEKSYQHLEKNGLLFIAAEGVSWMERWVRPFKTGAARIAFGAEARNEWDLEVKIVPIGLSYSAPNLFRSEVIVHYGEPIPVGPWADAEKRHHEKAVEDFTADIQQHVRALVLDTRDKAGQEFVAQLEEIFQGEFPPAGDQYFVFRKNLIEKNIDNESLRIQTAAYFEALHQHKMTDIGVNEVSNPRAFSSRFLTGICLLLGLPFFLLGYGLWFLPCYIPWLVTKKLKLYIGYDSNVKMVVGLFTFPPGLWAAFWAGSHFFGSGWWGLVVVVSVVLLGLFTERYQDFAKRWQKLQAAASFGQENPLVFESIISQRKAIVSMAVPSHASITT